MITMRTDQTMNQPPTLERVLMWLSVAFLIASVLLFNLTLPR